MHRREFISGGLAVATATAGSGHAQAYNQCVPAMTPAGQICEAGVNINQVISAYKIQEFEQWCWAASISMIFKYYGYTISQQSIVQAVYGTPANMPALSGSQISSQLNRAWTDQFGRNFRAQLRGLYDFNAGVTALTNAQIVNALASGSPLIMGNLSHAMVLVSVAYYPTPSGPQITNIGLADPYPGVGLRGPNGIAELYPMHAGGGLRYLALPVITPL